MAMHFDNATPRTAKCTIDYLRANRLIWAPYPVFSLDLASLEFYLLGRLKMALMRAAFADELLQCVMEVLNGISREEFEAVFEEWLLRSDRYIQQNGEYVEEGEFNKHILIIVALFCVVMLKFSGTSCIHAKLSSIFAGIALSHSTVQKWLRRFKEGNTLCEDAERSGRPMIIIGDILSKFVARYPFASAKVISRYFRVSPSTVNKVLSRELGFRKYARGWVPHLLDGGQKNHRSASTIELLELFRRREAHDFDGIATGKESWFHYHYEPREKFALSREKGHRERL
jgi:transposase